MLEGHSFIVGAAVSIGGRDIKPGINVYRFANRIPLLFEVHCIPHLTMLCSIHNFFMPGVQLTSAACPANAMLTDVYMCHTCALCWQFPRDTSILRMCFVLRLHSGDA